MATEPDERRWREAMERLGADTVRAKLTTTNIGPDTRVRYIVSGSQPPTREFVEAWLGEKDAFERKHRARVDGWTLAFAAIGAATGLAVLTLTMWRR
jgi:hypothetical protein